MDVWHVKIPHKQSARLSFFDTLSYLAASSNISKACCCLDSLEQSFYSREPGGLLVDVASHEGHLIYKKSHWQCPVPIVVKV